MGSFLVVKIHKRDSRGIYRGYSNQYYTSRFEKIIPVQIVSSNPRSVVVTVGQNSIYDILKPHTDD